MKKTMLIVFLSLFCTYGCGRQCPYDNKDVVARINNYVVTGLEFDKEFAASSFAKKGTIESKKEFLSNLVDQKLILQDAEKKGLDKSPEFLNMVQRFWEQSLMKLAIERKTREVANSSFVSDKAVEEAYNKMASEGKADKPYSSMSQQIKWEITKLKESQVMGVWLADLRAKSQVSINYNLLDKNKQ
ncbi:MAG: hypothetical protein NTY47_02330, partial [Candidatus Omnitrophica bacterium]|nr:hypothetical protein [Candidatus Omnitrophota bacterium]